MSPDTVTIHSSLLFDPKKKAFLENQSIKVDRERGIILDVYERTAQDSIHHDDIDLRGSGRVVMPGFVDSHPHILLHSYE